MPTNPLPDLDGLEADLNQAIEEGAGSLALECRRAIRSLREPNVATVSAYEAGREDGMREAAEIAERELRNCVRRQREQPRKCAHHATAGASSIAILHEIRTHMESRAALATPEDRDGG